MIPFTHPAQIIDYMESKNKQGGSPTWVEAHSLIVTL